MAKDLRAWIDHLRQEEPAELRRVSRLVKPQAFEPSALLEQLERRHELPAVFFEQITNLRGQPSPFRLVMNVFATQRKIGTALDLPPVQRTELLSAYLARSRKPKPVTPVRREEAPVKAVVRRGAEADLRDLPMFRHVSLEGGPYWTPIVAARDPESGRYNISWNRAQYLDPQHLGMWITPRHLAATFKAQEAKDRNLPVAVVVGHHPAFHLVAAGITPLSADEYETASGVLGEALRVVPSETWGEDLLVPADAEIVVEGELVAGKRTVEGPFGEFTGYAGPQRISYLLEVKAITYRPDAIFIDIFPCKPDHLGAHLPIEAGIFERAREAVPQVIDINWLDFGAPFNIAIKLDKTAEGQPMRAAMAALAAGNFLKHVVVVDKDIDVHNPKDVLWAVATRVQADTDLTVLRNLQANVLDPSLRTEIKGAGMIIDATKPLDRPYPERGVVPEEVLSRVRLEDYLEEGMGRNLSAR